MSDKKYSPNNISYEKNYIIEKVYSIICSSDEVAKWHSNDITVKNGEAIPLRARKFLDYHLTDELCQEWVNLIADIMLIKGDVREYQIRLHNWLVKHDIYEQFLEQFDIKVRNYGNKT